MTDHIVVCGTGDVGRYVIGEMLATQRPFVAVDENEEHLRRLSEGRQFLYVVGDATDEEVLVGAGIKAASGVVCSLEHDSDNLVLAMTCRMQNPKVRIVAKCHDVKLSQRLRNAGADAVVSPQFIGGMRLVSEMIRPTVVSFLDLMLRDKEKGIRVEEVRVQAGSALAGKTLTDRAVADTDVLILAIQAPGEKTFVYGPSSASVLQPGATMIVLGESEYVRTLGQLAAGR